MWRLCFRLRLARRTENDSHQPDIREPETKRNRSPQSRAVVHYSRSRAWTGLAEVERRDVRRLIRPPAPEPRGGLSRCEPHPHETHRVLSRFYAERTRRRTPTWTPPRQLA